jgi:hypothetical protein
MHTKFLSEHLKGRDYSGDQDIRLKDPKRKLGVCGLNSAASGYGPVVCSCEHGNEPSVSIRSK